MFKLQMQLKIYFVVPFVLPCMHHNYAELSESDACKYCTWPIILDAELYTTFPGEPVLVVMTHQVQCNILLRPMSPCEPARPSSSCPRKTRTKICLRNAYAHLTLTLT